MRKAGSTQPEHHNTRMATLAPDLYRPTTDADADIAAKPIRGMLFAVSQYVRHKNSGRTGYVDYCTEHTNGSRKYVVRWDDGRTPQRSWVWEVDLRDAEPLRPLGVEEAERARQAGATEPLLAGDTEPGRVSPADPDSQGGAE